MRTGSIGILFLCQKNSSTLLSPQKIHLYYGELSSLKTINDRILHAKHTLSSVLTKTSSFTATFSISDSPPSERRCDVLLIIINNFEEIKLEFKKRNESCTSPIRLQESVQETNCISHVKYAHCFS